MKGKAGIIGAGTLSKTGFGPLLGAQGKVKFPSVSAHRQFAYGQPKVIEMAARNLV